MNAVLLLPSESQLRARREALVEQLKTRPDWQALGIAQHVIDIDILLCPRLARRAGLV